VGIRILCRGPVRELDNDVRPHEEQLVLLRPLIVRGSQDKSRASGDDWVRAEVRIGLDAAWSAISRDAW